MAISSEIVQKDTARSGWVVPYYVRGLALGIPPYLVAIHLWTWIFSGSVFWGGSADFRQLYTAAFMVRTGHAHELYNYEEQELFQNLVVAPRTGALPFVSPAYHALFFVALSKLSFRQAYFVFLTINVSALIACLIMLRPWLLNLFAVYRWLPLSLVFGFLPIGAALLQGQDSILLTLVLVGTFVLLTRGRDALAGIIGALALFKFSIVLPIALLFLLWRRWRFLGGFVICAVILAAISVGMTGISQTRIYGDALLGIAGIRSSASGVLRNPVLLRRMADVHGFIFGVAGSWIPARLLTIAAILLSFVMLVWTALLGRAFTDSSWLLLISIPCSVLVSHHTYIYDLSILVLPLLVVLDSFVPGESSGNLRARLICLACVIVLVAPVLQSFAPEHLSWAALAVLALFFATVAGASMQVMAADSELTNQANPNEA